MSSVTEAAINWSKESFENGNQMEGAAKNLLVPVAIATDGLILFISIFGSYSDVTSEPDDRWDND